MVAVRRRRVIVAMVVAVALVASVGWLVSAVVPRTPAPPPARAQAGSTAARLVPGSTPGPVVVLGASISAGTGTDAEQAWPALLGRCLKRPVLTRTVPGAGYVARGRDGRGPMGRLVGQVNLARVDPSIVLIQAGYNDIGVASKTLAEQVRVVVGTVHQTVPGARLGLVTVFTRQGRPSVPARETDAAIVAAARSSVPGVTIIDPLVEGWTFSRVSDGLHPSVTGQQEVTRRVLVDLARVAAVSGFIVPLSSMIWGVLSPWPEGANDR